MNRDSLLGILLAITYTAFAAPAPPTFNLKPGNSALEVQITGTKPIGTTVERIVAGNPTTVFGTGAHDTTRDTFSIWLTEATAASADITLRTVDGTGASTTVTQSTQFGAISLVQTMPDRLTEAGHELRVWGNTNYGRNPGHSATYTWSFVTENVTAIPDQTGSVTTQNCSSIDAWVTPTLTAGSTKGRLIATLSIVDGTYSTTQTATVAIDVLATPSQDQQRAIAIQDGLTYLYGQSVTNTLDAESGHQRRQWNYGDKKLGPTAIVLWAFLNSGYKLDTDHIYQLLLEEGFNEIFDSFAPANGTYSVPSLTGNSRWGYGRAMALAAMTATEAPLSTTDIGIFGENGTSTTYLTIAQYIVDVMTQLADDGTNGGWHYDDNSTGGDFSVSAWHVVALEGAERFGITVPASVQDSIETMLVGFAASPTGSFGYWSSGDPTDGTTAGALSFFVMLNSKGRTWTPSQWGDSLAHQHRLWNLREITNRWYDIVGQGDTDTYLTWAVTRALRTAHIQNLHSTQLPNFDWQRRQATRDTNGDLTTADPYEGVWVNLLLNQERPASTTPGDHGRWYSDNATHPDSTLSTAYAVLTLNDGVFGHDRINDVQVESYLPDQVGIQIESASHQNIAPTITDEGDELKLVWNVGSIQRNQTVDLSYDVTLTNLTPNESRQTQTSLTATYRSGDTIQQEDRGTLVVDVTEPAYTLDLTLDQSDYSIADTAQITVTATFPPGQAIHRLAKPAEGEHLVVPAAGNGAPVDWTALTYAAIATPPALEHRAWPDQAASQDTEARTLLPWTALPDLDQANPFPASSVVELNLDYEENAAALQSLTLHYNHSASSIKVELLDANDAIVATLTPQQIASTQFGDTITLNRDYELSQLQDGIYQARASIVVGEATVAVSETSFTVDEGVTTAALNAAIAADADTYPVNADAKFTSTITNVSDQAFTNLSVTIVLDDPGPTTWQYTIADLQADENISRVFPWNTGSAAPDNYTVTQTISGLVDVNGAPISVVDTDTFAITTSDWQQAISGTLSLSDHLVTRPAETTSDVDATVRNIGNTGISVDITRRLVLQSDTNTTLMHNTLTAQSLSVAEDLPLSQWNLDLSASDLDQYLVLLEATDGTNTKLLDAASLAVRSTWHGQPATVSFFGEDNRSGVDTNTYEYSTDNGSNWTSGTEFTLNTSGIHQVGLRVQDIAGHNSSETLSVQVDLDPPTEQSKTPAATTTDNQPTITLTVNELSGINPASVSVTLLDPGDQPLSTSTPTITASQVAFTPSAPLPLGDHDVSITLRDLADHQFTINWTFTVQ